MVYRCPGLNNGAFRPGLRDDSGARGVLLVTILDRYLIRETLKVSVGVTSVLLIILVVSRFAQFVGEAARGGLPPDVLLKLLGLTTLHYCSFLVPAAFFIAVLLTLGRMYRDNEMAAIFACGIGVARLYRPLMLVALGFALLVAFLTFVAGPWTGHHAYTLRAEARHSARVGLVEPGQFRQIGADGVFYVEAIDDDGLRMQNVFVALNDDGVSSIITAESGEQYFDEKTGARGVVLRNGSRYQGVPGDDEFQVLHFVEHGIHVQLDRPVVKLTRQSLKPTADLLLSEELKDRAELQWRLALPLSLPLLALLAVPVARVQPRQGRYAKLLMGILVYFVYFNLLSFGASLIGRGDLAPGIGLWPAHGLVLLFALASLYQQHGLSFLVRRQREVIS